MSIVNSSGSPVATYKYDPYGNVLTASGTMAEVNPLRYRGYYYDSESGFYYLQSRYYDPELGRFINADAFASTGQGILGNNMFAYCNNNPVNQSDPNGEVPIEFLGLILLGVINNGVNAIYYEFSDGESDLTSDSYTEKDVSITRWEKLDYTKQNTGEDHYNVNAWRFYNEYTVHEYGWYVVGWADEKEIVGLSWLADRFENADVLPADWDERWYVNAATLLFGLLGM